MEAAWPWSPVDRQIKAFFGGSPHPFQILRHAIDARLSPQSAVLDIGCGREAKMLRRLIGKAGQLYGVDLECLDAIDAPGLIFARESVCDMRSVPDASIDLAYSKAVMEHIDDVAAAYAEIQRVLRPGATYVFLTPNLFDYASLASLVVPNAWHPPLVKMLEGRKPEDVFPVYYRSNTRRQIRSLAANAGFEVSEFQYLGQYPSYLAFNRPLFWLGCVYGKAIAKLPGLGCLLGWILCVLEKR
jgi:SAM-dependent methyltransferase